MSRCRSGLPLVLMALGCAEAPAPFSNTAGASAVSEVGGAGAGLGGGPPAAMNRGAGLASAGVASGGTPPAMVEVGASVLERSGNAARTSHYVVPALTRAAVAKFFYDRSFSAPFEGDVVASPLYWQEGEPGQGLVLVTTTSNDVHGIDANSGSVRWTRNLGAGPSGIVSTPVIDPASKTVYVTEAAGPVHALSMTDGNERDGYPLALSPLLPGFDPLLVYQRAALSLSGGKLYVAYDVTGMSHGAVLAIDVTQPRLVLSWLSQMAGAGIGAPGGMASDGDGVLFATGPALSPGAQHYDSQTLLRLRPSSTEVDEFHPVTWQQMDAGSANLGASGPILVDLPGATPAKYVAQLSGDGHLYLLDAAKLGGAGGQLLDFPVAQGSAAIRTAPTTYRTAQGTYLAFTAASGVTCPVGSPAPPGGNTGQVVASVRLTAGAPLQAELAWCYYLISGQGAPTSSTSNGSDDATVWVMDDVKLLGLDGDTGRAVFDGGHDISGVPFAERTCPGVAPYTSPIPVGNRMMIAAKGRLCAWAEQ